MPRNLVLLMSFCLIGNISPLAWAISLAFSFVLHLSRVHTAHVQDVRVNVMNFIRGHVGVEWRKLGVIEDRVQRWMAFDLKRPLSDCQSLQELIGALIDAIKGDSSFLMYCHAYRLIYV